MSWDYNGYLHLGVGFSLEQKPKFSFSNLRLKKVILKILTLSLRIWSDIETQLTQKSSSESEKIIFCSNKFQFCNYEKYFFCWFSLLMSHWPHTVKDINLNGHCSMVTSMLVTNVGDQMCWWQVWDVGDRFNTLRKSPT